MPSTLAVQRSELFKGSEIDGETAFVLPDPERIFRLQSELLERDICETDDDYVQLMPFITIFDPKSGDIYLSNKRADFRAQGNSSRYTLGLTDHIETKPFGLDESYAEDFKAILAMTAATILNSKLGLNIGTSLYNSVKNKLDQGKCGCIYFAGNYHDRHHLAISVFIGVSKEDVLPSYNLPATHGAWLSVEDIEKSIDDKYIEIDYWSQIVLGLASYS